MFDSTKRIALDIRNISAARLNVEPSPLPSLDRLRRWPAHPIRIDTA
jgi:hypothetical protein